MNSDLSNQTTEFEESQKKKFQDAMNTIESMLPADMLERFKKSFANSISAPASDQHPQVVDHKKSNFLSDDWVYVKELKLFYNKHKKVFYDSVQIEQELTCLTPLKGKKYNSEGELISEGSHISFAYYFKQHPECLESVDAIDYRPDREDEFYTHVDEETKISKTYINMYKPPRLKFIENTAKSDVDWYLNHLTRLMGEECATHFIKYCAWLIQHPETTINHNVLLQGVQGCGKDSAFMPIRKIIGESNVSLAQSTALSSNFNSFLEAKRLLIIDELNDTTEWNMLENRMKTMTTSAKIAIERKGKDIYHASNFIHVFAASNYDVPLKLSKGDRRWFVVRCSEDKPSSEYFNEFYAHVENQEDINKLFSYLRSIDVSDFRPKADAPETEAKIEMIEDSRCEHDILVDEAITYFENEHEFLLTPKKIVEYIKEREEVRVKPQRAKPILKQHGWKLLHSQKSINGMHVNNVWVPKDFTEKIDPAFEETFNHKLMLLAVKQ